MAVTKKKKSDSAEETGAEALVSGAPGNAWWPEEFSSPTTAKFACGFMAVWSVLLFWGGNFDSLLWFKRLLMIILGVFEPTRLAAQATSWDVAAVFWAAGIFAGLAVIHPALSLIFLMLVRPWLDAYTYQTDNIYFTWAIMALTVAWGRARGNTVPLLLLTGFLACMALSTVGSIHFDKSFRYTVFWAGHLGLFMVVLNLARDRRIFNLLLCGFFVTVATEVLYAIPHFKLLLPYVRKTLMEDPSWLMQYYGSAEMSPELARRFNINRAFGNMLFPNALAGYYVLAAPGFAVLTWIGVRRFAAALQARGGANILGGPRAWLGFACAGGFVVFVVVCTEGLFLSALDDGRRPEWYESLFVILLYSAVAGVVVGSALYALARRGGLLLAGYGAWACGAALCLPFFLYSLVTTYSRGAFLALAAACIITGAIYALSMRRALGRGWGVAAVSVLALVLAAPVLFGAAGDAAGAAAAPAAPSAEVLESGVDLSVSDLADTSTFGLRIGYWKVGLSMLKDYWLRGTGIAAFEMVYPKYQHIGAGEVREVHNSALQMFIETGIAGGTLFLLFWGYVLFWGMRRILRVTDSGERLLLCGLYGGMLAFLGHSLLDIHFSHHGLIFFAVIFAALFLARAAGEAAEEGGGPRWLVMAVFGFCTIVSGLGLQFYLHDLALSRATMIDVGNKRDAIYRMQVLDFFSRQVNQQRWSEERRRLQISYGAVQSLVVDEESVRVFAVLLAPTGVPGGLRPMGADERPTPETVAVIERNTAANRMALEYGSLWLANWARVDEAFPHDSDFATLLAESAMNLHYLDSTNPHVDMELDFRNLSLEWRRRAIARNPMNSGTHTNLARALVESAGMGLPIAEQRALWEEALGEMRLALALGPLNTDTAFGLAGLLEQYAGFLEAEEAGHPDIAARREEAARIREEALALIKELVDLRTPGHLKQ